MKTNTVVYWVTGAAFLGAGIFTILQGNAIWPPVLIFLGCTLICAPVGFLREDVNDYFSLPMRKRKQSPEEPLFYTKLFMHLAWIARNFGILELCGTKLDKTCSHPLYWLGKSFVIDGYDQDYALHSMRIATSYIRRRMERKVQNAKQVGNLLFFVGSFGALATTTSFTARQWSGATVDIGSVCVAATLSFLLLMGSAILALLIPARLRCEYDCGRQLEQ